MSERGHGYREDYDTVTFHPDNHERYCDDCGEANDIDCFGNDRCPNCDEPCTGCYSGECDVDYCAGDCGGVATNGRYCESGCEDDSNSN